MTHGEERENVKQGGIESGKVAIEPQDPEGSEKRGGLGTHAITGSQGDQQAQIR